MKKTLSCLAFVLALAVSLKLPSYAAEIAVIINVPENRLASGPHRETIAGFTGLLSERGISFNTTLYNLAGKSGESEILSKITESSPDLILAVGSEAAALAGRELKDIPAVFTMVLNPVEQGFVESLSSSGNNLTGVSLNIPPAKQFETIKMALPALKKIGVIYDPSNSQQIIEEAESAAAGLGIKLIKRPVKEAREIAGALDSLRGDGADIIWAIPDSTVYSGASVRQVLLYSLRNNIPVAGFSKSFAEAGALIGIYQDYSGIGRQTAEAALRVLSGENPSGIPIASPRDLVFSLNQRVMEAIGVHTNGQSLQKAEHIFK